MADSKGLTAERVSAVFADCFFKDGEDRSTYVPAIGIQTNVGFHPGRLEDYKVEIVEMLGELPDTFKEGTGDGWSFLQACNDKHGHQWTGLHRTMEQLFLLGMAIGKVSPVLPREMWSTFAGGMPYYVIHKNFKQVELKAA